MSVFADQDSVVFDEAEIYQGMLGVDGDTVLGYWWAHAFLGQDSLGLLMATSICHYEGALPHITFLFANSAR